MSLAVSLAALGLTGSRCGDPPAARADPAATRRAEPPSEPEPGRALTLFLAGDVMTGRGIDQVLPHSVDPVLHEPWVTDARDYVRLAEAATGPIPDDVGYAYVWGDSLAELERVAPHARVINLETAVTTSDQWWPGKAIHYRMHPANVPLLTAAGIDVTVLGNNHVLDWGYPGLHETLASLRAAGLQTTGAGADRARASAPAIVDTSAGRVLVFSYGAVDAGVPPEWAAARSRAGVNLIHPDTSGAREVAEHVRAHRQVGDRVVLSMHWGGNWGYDVPERHRAFAHALIDDGAVDLIHGHSSHHPRPMELYRDRLILYGCGDFINDYEGIGGREEYRADLTAMYFPTLASDGTLHDLTMTPMRIRRFRLERPEPDDARWLAGRLDRESRRFGARILLDDHHRLRLSDTARQP